MSNFKLLEEDNHEDDEILKFIEENYDIISEELFGKEDDIETAKDSKIDMYNNKKNNIVIDDKIKNNKKIKFMLEEEFDIFEYFVLYNTLFFEDKLGAVKLEWSKKMTLCAGIFSVKNNQTVIRLSEPLLKFRSIEEVKETLLHEMIHAWIHVEDLDISDDRSGHGAIFKMKMYEINKNTGLNITIYHSFHDEVEYYRKYIWKCNGPCQHRSPYYGLVKRAINRPPGKSDNWWADHQINCGGEFIKIEEPSTKNENFEEISNKRKTNKEKKKNVKKKTLDDFVKIKKDK